LTDEYNLAERTGPVVYHGSPLTKMQIVHFFCPQQEVHCKMQGIRPSSTKNSLISLHREKQKQRNPKTHSTPERFLVDNIKPDFS
jgi:hypothetical protein